MQRRQMRLLSRYVSNGNRRRLTVRSPQQATALVWHEVVADGPDPHGESRRRHADSACLQDRVGARESVRASPRGLLDGDMTPQMTRLTPSDHRV